jgi:hypothetical protein
MAVERPVVAVSSTDSHFWVIDVRDRLVPADLDSPGDGDTYGASVHETLTTAARRVTSSARHVRCVRTIYIPGEQRCICLFEASDAGMVQLVNETAQLPFVRVAAAHAFPADPASRGADL